LAVGKNNDGIHFLKTDSNLAYGSIHTGNNILFDMVNDKDRLLVGTGAGALLEVDIQSLSVIRRAQISEKSIRCLAINKTTGQVAVGSSDNHIRIFEYPEMNCSKAWPAHLNSVFGVAFSPDGKSLISVSRDAHLKKWDVVEDYENIRSIPAHLFAINKVAISPDGEYFVTCSMDKTIKLWSGETCELLRVLDKNRHGGHSNSVNCAIWLNSDIFITAGDDCKISIWKLNKSYI
jgi:WD40 repeat protein